jgi:CheY-like chemotaxis protein
MERDVKYVLYADDDNEDRETLREVLSAAGEGLEVVGVENGLQLIHYLDTLKSGDKFPCFVLLDVNMPVMNGLETLTYLKTHPVYSNLKIVVYSTSTQVHDKIAALERNADEFITKPFRFVELQSVANQFADMCHTVPARWK